MSLNFNQITKIEIPKYPYHQIDYIYFNGVDNYIEDESRAWEPYNSSLSVEFELDDVSSGYIVGAYKLYTHTGTSTTLPEHFYIYANNGRLWCKYQTGYWNSDLQDYSVYPEGWADMCNISPNTRYTVIFSYYSTGLWKLTVKSGDTYLYDGETFNYPPAPAMFITYMARKFEQGGTTTYDNFAKGKVYSIKGRKLFYNSDTNGVGEYVAIASTDYVVQSKYYMQGTVNAQSRGNFVIPQTITIPQIEVTQIKNAQNVILWRNKRLVSIALTNPTTSLPIDSAFSFGGTVTATYSDGTTADVTSSTTFSGYDMSTAGTYTVTASYSEDGTTKTATYQLEVYASQYKLLEYIDIPSDAYIDLNNQGSNDTGILLDINFNPDGTSSQLTGQNILGSIYYNGTTYYRYHITTSSGNGLIQVWFGTGNSAYKDSGIYSNNSNRHDIRLNYTSKNTLYVDNVNKGTYTTGTSTSSGTLLLGARRFNNNGTVTINNYPRTLRVYSITVSVTGGSSIFYPVIRRSDGAVGFYKVYNSGQATRFIESETSTDLIPGPVVDNNWEP